MHSKRIRLGLISLGLIALLVAAIEWRRPGESGEWHDSSADPQTPSAERESRARPTAPPSPTPKTRRPVEGRAEAGTQRSSLVGIVEDELTGGPVRARIGILGPSGTATAAQAAEVEALSTTDARGRFAFTIDRERWRSDARVQVSAPGYSSFVEELATVLDAGRRDTTFHIRLQPAPVCTCRVVGPIDRPSAAGTIVEWRSFDARNRAGYQPRLAAGVVDAQGFARIRSTKPLLVRALTDVGVGHSTSPWYRATPDGDPVEIVLAATPTIVEFIHHESGDPIANATVEVQFEEAQSSMPAHYTTDQAGQLSVSAEFDGLRARFVTEGFSFSETQGVSQAVVDDREIRVTSGSREGIRSGDVLQLLVEGNPYRVRCLDRGSSEPITRPISISLFTMVRGEGWSRRSTRTSQPVDGVVYVDDADWLDDASTSVRYRVAAEDYRPLDVADSALRSARPDALTVTMQPQVQLSVYVLQDDGRPYRAEFAVTDATASDFLLVGAPDARGRLGSLDWTGGGLGLLEFAGDLGAFTPASSELVSALKADEITGSERIEFRVSRPTGEIVIEEALERSLPIVAIHHGGAQFGPEVAGASELRFIDLPIGMYAVGPRDRAAADLAPYGLGDSSGMIEVRADEITHLPWDPSWSGLEEDLTGLIHVDGVGLSEVRVESYYGEPHTIWPYRWDAMRLPVDSDGRYRIETGEPVPTLMVVSTPNPKDGRFGPQEYERNVVAVLEPGESITLGIASLTLRTSCPVEGGVEVRIALPPTRYRGWEDRVPQPAQFVYRDWSTSEPLDITGLPTGLTNVEMTGRDGRVHSESIEFTAGRNEIQLDL